MKLDFHIPQTTLELLRAGGLSEKNQLDVINVFAREAGYKKPITPKDIGKILAQAPVETSVVETMQRSELEMQRKQDALRVAEGIINEIDFDNITEAALGLGPEDQYVTDEIQAPADVTKEIPLPEGLFSNDNVSELPTKVYKAPDLYDTRKSMHVPAKATEGTKPRQRHKLLVDPNELGLTARIKTALLQQDLGISRKIQAQIKGRSAKGDELTKGEIVEAFLEVLNKRKDLAPFQKDLTLRDALAETLEEHDNKKLRSIPRAIVWALTVLIPTGAWYKNEIGDSISNIFEHINPLSSSAPADEKTLSKVNIQDLLSGDPNSMDDAIPHLLMEIMKRQGAAPYDLQWLNGYAKKELQDAYMNKELKYPLPRDSSIKVERYGSKGDLILRFYAPVKRPGRLKGDPAEQFYVTMNKWDLSPFIKKLNEFLAKY